MQRPTSLLNALFSLGLRNPDHHRRRRRAHTIELYSRERLHKTKQFPSQGFSFHCMRVPLLALFSRLWKNNTRFGPSRALTAGTKGAHHLISPVRFFVFASAATQRAALTNGRAQTRK